MSGVRPTRDNSPSSIDRAFDNSNDAFPISQIGSNRSRSMSPSRQSSLSETRAQAARNRVFSQISSQQQDANHLLDTMFTTYSNEFVENQCEQLISLGRISDVRSAKTNLQNLSNSLKKKSDCDDLLEALEDKHENSYIDINSYRMYADALSEIKQSLPESLNLSNSFRENNQPMNSLVEIDVVSEMQNLMDIQRQHEDRERFRRTNQQIFNNTNQMIMDTLNLFR